MTRLVFIHGAFCGGWAWDGFRGPFEAAGFRVEAPTLRGHAGGHRPQPPGFGEISLRDYAGDLAAELRRSDEPAVLIGHSLGGLLAQMLAALPRLPIAGLALLAPSPPWGVLPSAASEIAAAQGLYLAGDFWRQPLAPRYWIAKSHALDRVPDPARRHVFARFVPESGRAMFEALHWPLDAARTTDVPAHRVRCPVWAAAGGRDGVNAPGTVARIARRYGGSCTVYPEMSHWLIGEPGYEQVAADALAFVKRIAGA